MSTKAETKAAPDWRAAFLAACAALPDTVEKTAAQIEEETRMADFKRVCDEKFCQKIDRALLACPESFDRVAQWHGKFPGPCATGTTGAAKTRAAWSALGRLYVREKRSFAWFPARRLVGEMERYEKIGVTDEFFRQYDHFRVLFVDDIDKINWQFESQQAALFAFYDWIYRHQKPCITTTNNSRAWWAERMGDAFARRLFDDAHFTVEFEAAQQLKKAA